LAEVVWNLVAALAGYEDPQLGLEVEGLQARGAVVEVVLDLFAALRGKLTVEEVVEEVDHLPAIVPGGEGTG
jgi:hypothetical protein